MPVIDISSVRGIGVADIVSTSTAVRKPLQLLLVLDAEALLLVDHDQAEILERDLAAEQPVRPDHDVDRAVGQPVDRGLGLLVGLEPRQRRDVHRERGVPLGEGRVVLLDEQRGRHQDGDLLAVLDRLERGPDGDLGLAVADVAADDPVHRHDAFHVVLDVVDGGQLVRRLDERERVLELALPRRVLGERVALGRLARGVQLDQLAGDLADRLARAALALGPVAAAHLVQRGLLATDVPGDLVELVGRHEQAVAGLAALARRELDHDVLAGGPLGAGADRALHHLDVPADAVLLVHDEVAGRELQRVDGLLAAARHPLLGTAFGRRALPGQVVLGEHRELDAFGNEPVLERALGDQYDARLGDAVDRVDGPGRQLRLGEHLGQPLGRAVALGDADDPPAVPQPAAHVLDGGRGLTAVRIDLVGRDLPAANSARVGVDVERDPRAHRVAQLGLVGRRGRERRQAPPGQPAIERLRPYVGQRHVRRGAQVDRRLAAPGGRRPGRLQELLAGRDQVVRPGANPLGVADDDVGAFRHQVDQQLHVVDQDGRERLHPLDRVALGELLEQLGQLRVLLGQYAGAGAHLVGQQQLAARRSPQAVLGDLQRPLVGDREVPDLLDVVAEEVDPQRVLLGRREDVDDAAADRELTAPLDQVDPAVRRAGEPGDHVLQLHGVADVQLDRAQVGQTGDLRLQHGPDRRDQDLDRPGRLVGRVRVHQAPQYGEPPADGVGPGRQPLVRQRLPGRVVGDRAGLDQALQRLGQLLGLAERRGDREHRAVGAEPLGRERGQQDRTDRAGRAQVERRDAGGTDVLAGVTDRVGDHRIGDEGVDQTGQFHELYFPWETSRPSASNDSMASAVRSSSNGRSLRSVLENSFSTKSAGLCRPGGRPTPNRTRW